MWKFDPQSGTATRVPLREGSAHGLGSPRPRPFAAAYWDNGVYLQLGTRRWQLDDETRVTVVSQGRLRSHYVIGRAGVEVPVTATYGLGASFRRLIGTLYDQLEAETDDLLYFVATNKSQQWLARVMENWRLGI